MDSRDVLMDVSIRPHPLAAWFHHLLTAPVVEMDGHVCTGHWGKKEMTVSSGPHRINAYFRYRGQSAARLGEASKEFTVSGTTQRIGFKITLGLRNGSSFTIDGPTLG